MVVERFSDAASTPPVDGRTRAGRPKTTLKGLRDHPR